MEAEHPPWSYNCFLCVVTHGAPGCVLRRHIDAFVCMLCRQELQRLQEEQQRAWEQRMEQQDELFQRHEQQKVSGLALSYADALHCLL